MAKNRRLRCDECRRLYQLEKRQLHGFDYELYVCPKCEDTLFTLEQAKAFRQVHALAELSQKPLGPLTLRRVGNSLNATVPRELAAVGFESGRRFRWELQGPGTLTLQLIESPTDEEKPDRPVRSKKKKAA